MRVLSLEDARTLEALIRERSQTRRGIAPVEGATAEMPADVSLLTLSPAEVVRLGLIPNRGMVVVAAAFGAIWQSAGGRFSADDLPGWFTALAEGAGRYVSDHIHDVALLGIAAATVLLALVAAVRALSVLLALLQYHGFRLTEVGRQLRVERGLLTRVRNQLPRRRIQAWRIEETLLHRWLGRQSVRVDSAAGGQDEDGVRHLVPIGTPAQVDALVGKLASGTVWPVPEWRGVHPRAWRRMFIVPSLAVAALSIGGTLLLGPAALVSLLLIPLVVIRARRLAAFEAYACVDHAVAVRTGWLSRRWGLIDARKVQAVQLTESPIDRRHGMATVWFDSAGASATEGVLRARHLALEDARALYARVSALMDAR
jgi:putative membrane protein